MDEHSNYHAGGHSYSAAPDTTPSLLLVWDGPNIDMGLGSIVGGRPSAHQRPRFDAIGLWLVEYADQLSAELGQEVEPEATVFTNVTPGSGDVVRPWVDALRNVGFAVFAKPKVDEDTDVDQDMIDHINRRHAEGVLRGVVVASADRANFQDRLLELADEGIPVTVLGFVEHNGWALGCEQIRFIDLEDIPQVFHKPLPRVNLDNLPDGGAWLQPFRPIRSLGRGA